MKATIQRATAIGVVLALALTGCGSDNNDDEAAEETTTTSARGDETTTSSTAEPPSVADEAAEVWTQAWDLAGEQTSTPATLADLTVPAAAERMVTTLHLGADDQDTTFEGRHVTNHPVVDDNGDGTFTINDCMLISPPVTPAESNWYSGTIETIDGQLVVSEVIPEAVTGCVPAAIAEQVQEVWDRYWALWAEGVQSGNSEFEQLITGDYADVILPNLEARPDGQVFRQFDTHHPEIIEFRPDFIRISSCSNASAETGRYDVASGERLNVDVAEAEGAQNLYTLNLVHDEGVWRISGRGAELDVDCQPAPTQLGIPEVG